jgi:hypothetical protein
LVLRPDRLSERLRTAGALTAPSAAGDGRRIAWAALAIAIAASFPLILHLSRGTTFSLDELDWFMTSPGLGVESALEPHSGHLVLTTRVVAKLVLEAFGSGYTPFLLLTVGAAATLAVALFAYLGRRVGPLVALAPVLVLLYFGSDAVHVATGNGFTVLGALACGVGALLALERDDRRGDAAACALLSLGVVTYTVALPFVVAVAVLVLVGGDRWRRAWVFVVPGLIYAAWLVWARSAAADPGGEVAISNALLLPSWAFQSLAATLGALVGLGYDFEGEGSARVGAGIPLALLAVAGVAWRLRRGPAPAALYATLAGLLALWLMGALSASILRVPEDPRYLYPVAVGSLLVGAWAAREVRWTRAALIGLYAVAAVGLASNLALLRERAADYRSGNEVVRAEMTGLEVAGEQVVADFDLEAATGGRSFWVFPFLMLNERGESPAELYVDAVERYGALGLSPEELRDRGDPVRQRADAVLVAALGLDLAPVGEIDARRCLEAEGEAGGEVDLELQPDSLVVLRAEGADGPLTVRRFAGEAGVEIGELRSGQPAALELPGDGLPDPWRASGPGPALLVCPLR